MSATTVTLDDTSRVLDDHPRLTTEGNEVRAAEYRYQSFNTFEYRRDRLRNDCLEEVQRSYDWLNENPCWSGSSYTGKHLVERDNGGPGSFYVSNGAFVVAAVLSGRKVNWGSRNASVNPEISAVAGVRCRAGRPVGQKAA